jgi:hypothetical protein
MGGSLTDEELKSILELASKFFPDFIPTTAIETGTYKGVSTRLLAKFFKHVHTLEINFLLYAEAIRNGKEFQNITYHLGDSVELLPDIVKGVHSAAGVLYFIDAHGSGSDSGRNEKENVPLFSELDIILKNREPNQPTIYIIDDVRLFNAFSDWEGITVESIRAKIPNIVSEFVKDDRYYILAR